MPKQQIRYVALLSIAATVALIASSCQKNPMSPSMNVMTTPPHRMGTASINGSAGDMPAYYDSTRFTINFAMLSDAAANATLTRNSSINNIYRSDQLLPGGQQFVAVLDAIQGDGFNPLWREIDIVFHNGVTPHQFFSDNQILDAAGAANPGITLDSTNEMYRCSVVGPK